MNRRSIFLLAAALALPLAAGCSHNDPNAAEPKEQVTAAPTGLTASTGGKSNSGPSDTNFQEAPIDAKTYFAAGQLAEAQGNLKLASEQYAKAANQDRGFLMALYRLGVVYSRSKDWQNAVATWNRYIEETNGTASAWSNLGFCYELMGDAVNAEAAYKQGLARDPQSQPCRVNYGLMLARHSRYTEAEQQFKQVLTQGEVHYNIASIMEQQGKIKEAKAEYQLALQLDPALTDAKTRLAAVETTEFTE